MTNIYTGDFSRAQDLTGAVKDTGVYSELSIPLHGLKQIAVEKKVYVTLYPEVIFAGAGDTVDVDLWSDSIGTFATTPAQVAQALAVIPATWGPGDDPISFEIPFALIADGETHLALKYVPRGSGDCEAGTVSARVSLEPGRLQLMPRGDANTVG